MTRRQTLRARPTFADIAVARAFAPVDTPSPSSLRAMATDGETGGAVTQTIGGGWIELAPCPRRAGDRMAPRARPLPS